MLINLRNALMAGKRLPYDAEVEFLQTDGDAYIATGITPPTGATVKTELTFGFASSSRRRFLFSDGNQNATHYCEVNASAQYGAGTAYISQTLSADTMYSATATFTSALASYSIDINGTQYTSSTASFSTSAWRELILLRLSANYRGSGQRIGACKIYVNGVLARDFIAVRKGTVGYLYDRVSGKLFGNAGTGDFQYGQDVVPVEYIESTGTQWIDTGVLLKSNSRIECDFLLRQSATQAVFGQIIDANTGIFFGTASNSSVYCNNATVPISPVLTLSANTEYSVVQQGNSIVVNGVEYSTGGATNLSTSALLFARRENNVAGRIINGYIRRWDVYTHTSDPICKHRPVRVGNGATWEGAMMDVLTRRIYRNAGTGAFGYGNDLRYPIPAS